MNDWMNKRTNARVVMKRREQKAKTIRYDINQVNLGQEKDRTASLSLSIALHCTAPHPTYLLPKTRVHVFTVTCLPRTGLACPKIDPFINGSGILLPNEERPTEHPFIRASTVVPLATEHRGVRVCVCWEDSIYSFFTLVRQTICNGRSNSKSP